MHCWLDSWLARLVLHCMNFELWPRPGYTFTLWCMQGNQAPQYVSHLITNCPFSFLHTDEYNQTKKKSSVTFAQAFAALWAWCGQVRAEEPHLGECVACLDWNLATQPWHRVGYSGSKHFQILFASCPWDQTTATLYVVHISCVEGELALSTSIGNHDKLWYFQWWGTVHCTTHAGWLGMCYEAFHHSSSPFHYSIPPFHSIECRHPGQQEDKRAHNSTTKVSFYTIIIRLCHCMIAITRV